MDEAIYDVLQKRFQLVSLTKYDGTDLTPKEADGLGLGGAWIVSSNDGEHFAYDVQYSLSLGVDDITAGGLGSVEFSSKNELVAYEYFKANPQFSTVKLSSDKYATYTLDNYTSQRYYADGNDCCIANVIRIALRYGNQAVLEDGYGINMLPLATFAIETYANLSCYSWYRSILHHCLQPCSIRSIKGCIW